ncbi:MAG: serine O-acetyltransferase [Gammaproteobacteria bacterium]|nr:serine O-acetyltransferase [Gammaproteobacteria bacterium]MBQ0840307.1 serine O-acetyltransferase [Gammaproteobacteria bacterium]
MTPAKQTLANPCNESLWQQLVNEVAVTARHEPVLAGFLHSTILNHSNLAAALSFHLANKLHSDITPALLLREVFDGAFASDPTIIDKARCDIIAIYERDSASHDFSTPFLYYKGFHALTAYRVAHWLWHNQRRPLALVLQNRISVVLGVDIHPAAQIGKGIMFDHATGLVIGETAVVEDCVSILQSVTLGGTGKESGDRHPKVRRGVLIGPGAKVLGNIEIGEGSMVAAASVVLKDVPPHSIVAGVPAKVVGSTSDDEPAEKMDHGLEGCGSN